MLLEILLGSIFGILIEFHDRVCVFRFSTTGNEVVTLDTHLERAVFAVKRRTPWVFRIRTFSPSSMLPDYLGVAKIKLRRLGVTYIRRTLTIDEDSSL